MKLLTKAKDGGPASPVDGYFIFEIKGLCSLVLLKFNKGCRETFHSHAFNALTWFIKGSMEEETPDGVLLKYTKSLIPKITKRSKTHRVRATTDSWAISLRGPWVDVWNEYCEVTGKTTTLTHGRIVLKTDPSIL